MLQTKLDYASPSAADMRPYSSRHAALIWSLRVFGFALVVIDAVSVCATMLWFVGGYFPILTGCGVLGVVTTGYGLKDLRTRRLNKVKWLNIGLLLLWGRFWYDVMGFEERLQFDWQLVRQWYRDHWDPYLNQSGQYFSTAPLIDLEFLAMSLLLVVSILTLCLNLSEWAKKDRRNPR